GVFFFQAEDGIRDWSVTGVQTCALPILTHTVSEARLVAETAAKKKRVTQMGTQIHAGSNYRRVVELIQTGAIGSVREVHVWCGQIGRASGRGRGEVGGGGGGVKSRGEGR